MMMKYEEENVVLLHLQLAAKNEGDLVDSSKDNQINVHLEKSNN